MNRLLNIFLLFVFSAVVCFANTGEQSVKVNPGGTISIHMSSSDITINVWQKNEVLVRTNDDEELKITNRNNIVKIEPGISGYTEHLFVNIPSSFNVVVNTSAGDLEINGDIKGNLEIYNGGGDIDFRNINGRVIVKTGGGDIHGNNINGNTSLKSSGGDINLGSVKGKASIVTGGGNIKLNSVTVIDIINTSGGNIMMRDAAGNGEISTGGGNIDINKAAGNLNIFSYGGDIRVNELSGKIKTKTGGGTIRIKRADGSLDANTMSGEIIVNFHRLSGTSKLYSGNGSIRLGIAGSLHAKIVARSKDPEWWRDENSGSENIRSDFKAASLKKNKRSQEIETVYEINGGGPLIELQTNYGDIVIRKSQAN